MEYKFLVNDMPPKKDGSSSMWNKKTEVPRLISLRTAAIKAFNGAPPLEKNISLTINVYIPINNRTVGDLDNFITGICDGLMAHNINPNTKISALFSEPQLKDIYPDKPIGIIDDVEIINIQAKKIIGNCATPYYEVILQGSCNNSD